MIDQLNNLEVATPTAGIPRTAEHSVPIAHIGGLPVGAAILIVIAGAILGSVGSFLPWVSAQVLFFQAEETGVGGGDGIISLIASVAAGVCAILIGGRYRKPAALAAIVGGGIAAAVALYDIGHFYDLKSQGTFGADFASLEYGIFITATGGVLAAAGGLIGFCSNNSGSTAAAP